MEGIKIIGDVLENVPNNILDKLTEHQRVIYGIIKLNVPNNVPEDVPDIVVETAESLASKLSVSTKSIKRDLKRMKELGVIKREGGNFGGHWELIK